MCGMILQRGDLFYTDYNKIYKEDPDLKDAHFIDVFSLRGFSQVIMSSMHCKIQYVSVLFSQCVSLVLLDCRLDEIKGSCFILII